TKTPAPNAPPAPPPESANKSREPSVADAATRPAISLACVSMNSRSSEYVRIAAGNPAGAAASEAAGGVSRRGAVAHAVQAAINVPTARARIGELARSVPSWG